MGRKIKILGLITMVFISCSALASKNPIELFSNPTPTFPPNNIDEFATEKPNESYPKENTRYNPYLPNNLEDAFTLGVEVEKYFIGDTAWRMLETENQFNDPPPDGMQYVLVKIYVENSLKGGAREINRYDFRLTGSKNIRYRAVSQVPPFPELKAEIEFQESTSGWIPFLIDEDETGLTLIVDIVGFSFSDGEIYTYFALNENDLLVKRPQEIIRPPTSLGESIQAPAEINEKTSSAQWDIKISEMIRGDMAYEKILDANQFNDVPPLGMEYILFWSEVEYFNIGDDFGLINSSWFHSMNLIGDKFSTISVVKPLPEMRVELFSGGQYQGWVALLVEEHQPFIIMLDPIFDYQLINNRYIKFGN